MKNQHTPGPWHVGMKQAERIVYDPTGWAVANATVYHGEQDAAETLANARLIAAAPELAAALDRITRAYDELLTEYGKPFGWGRIESDNARAALAKAGLL